MAKNDKYNTEIVSIGGFADINRQRFNLNQASQQVLALNWERCYSYICNNSGYTIWLRFGVGPAIKDQDIALKPGDRYEITANNLWLGPVHFVAGVNSNAQFIEVAEGH